MGKINIEDGSGDKKYFTIIPNYIANHSTANDQALYFQMKRHAGEKGKCFATQDTLMKKLNIGRKAFNKSIKYLIDHNWITYLGLKGGKTRPIKTYKINDIWKLNHDFYEEKIPAERTVSIDKDSVQKEKDTGQKSSKIPAERTVEEEPVLRRTSIIDTSVSIAAAMPHGKPEINKIIDCFKASFNLSTLDGTIRENRKYAELLLKKCKNLDAALKVIMIASEDDFYADKLSSLKKLYYHAVEIVQRARGKNNKVVKIA